MYEIKIYTLEEPAAMRTYERDTNDAMNLIAFASVMSERILQVKRVELIHVQGLDFVIWADGNPQGCVLMNKIRLPNIENDRG